MRNLLVLAGAVAALSAPVVVRARPESAPGEVPPSGASETDLSGPEIDALLARLVDPADMAVRAAALTDLLEAQAGALSALVERLFRPNGITAGLQQRVIEDYIRRLPAELPPESQVPRRTALAPLLHLLVLAPHEAYQECWAAALQATGLLAALDVIDTNEALMEAIRFVSMYEGAYGRAVGLLVRAKGDRAIPALVLSRKQQNGNVREFIANQLARMGKDRAPLMAQVNDDQLLADILRAIAEVKDGDGVNVMVSFINSNRPFVRQAARESLMRYERNAIWAVRKAYEDQTGEPADTSWGWQETMERLFAAQDAARLEPLDALLARGLAAAREERYPEMDGAYGAILGREPQYPRRAEMVPGLLAYGEQLLSAGNVLEARRLLRLAGYLVPQGDARGTRIRAHLAYLEGLRRRDLGLPDAEPFREAATLDPAYAKLIESRGDLTALAAGPAGPGAEPTAEGPDAAEPAAGGLPAGRIAAAVGIALTALAGLFLLVSCGRVPGRLFARRDAPDREVREPAMAPPMPPTAGAESPTASEEPPAPAAAASPPPNDAYRRIELALARLRKDLPPPDPGTDGAGGTTDGDRERRRRSESKES